MDEDEAAEVELSLDDFEDLNTFSIFFIDRVLRLE